MNIEPRFFRGKPGKLLDKLAREGNPGADFVQLSRDPHEFTIVFNRPGLKFRQFRLDFRMRLRDSEISGLG